MCTPTELIPFSMDADWLFPRFARRKVIFSHFPDSHDSSIVEILIMGMKI